MSGMRSLWFLVLAIAVCFPWISIQAEVTWSGDVVPDDPTTWDENTHAYVGKAGEGTLNILDGGAVNNNTGHIGCYSGSSGEVTVEGMGSSWTNGSDLYVGGSEFIESGGNGVLNIVNGGIVTVEGDTRVGYSDGSSGTIHFDNGVLTTSVLYGDIGDFTGTGTVNTKSLISDVDLVFDATHGLNQTLNVNSNLNQNITINLAVDGSQCIGAGYWGVGTLNISDGLVLASTDGYIGYKTGSMGSVTVNGTHSTWTNNNDLYVGNFGNGVLNITYGGSVSNDWGYIGFFPGSTGEVTVDGVGSTWENNEGLYVGSGPNAGSGSGVLNIINQGTVNSKRGFVAYGYSSYCEVTVNGDGSKWINVYDLTVGNYGSGTMNITGGGLVSNRDGYISKEANSISEVIVNGIDSIWNNSRTLFVGYNGNATLMITENGTVNSEDCYIGSEYWAVGLVRVEGVGSTLMNSGKLYIGDKGSGVLNITGGGAVNNVDGAIRSSGEVTVHGTGSTWTNSGALSVSGLLNITDDGEVTVNKDTTVSGTISFDNGILNTGGLICAFDNLVGIGTVDTHGLVSDIDLIFDSSHGLNQTFNINENPSQNIAVNLNVNGSGSMGAGYSGVGTMRISDGLVIESTDGYVGYLATSTGEVTVEGVGSTWINSGMLCAGYFGSGALNVNNGGTVISDSGYIGLYGSTESDVTIDGIGSAWTNSNDLSVGYVGYGVLNITNGGKVSNHNGYIGRFGSSSGLINAAVGDVLVNGMGSLWQNNGNLFLGDLYSFFDDPGIGTLEITEGGLVSVAGTLTIDGVGAGESFINMSSGGMLALMGDVDDSLAEFLGIIDGTDAIRYWDYALGDWADITTGTLGEDYTLSYITTPGDDLFGYTVLTVLEVALLDGDANRDGVVSAGDYAYVRAHFGDVGLPGLLGDANGDGLVSADDYACIQANFGNVAGAEVTPEPATMSLLAIGGLALLRKRK